MRTPEQILAKLRHEAEDCTVLRDQLRDSDGGEYKYRDAISFMDDALYSMEYAIEELADLLYYEEEENKCLRG